MFLTASRKRKAWSAVVGLLALFGALWIFNKVREPTYQDKPLGFWLRALDQPSDRDAALQAIDAIGPRCIPALVHRLRDTDSQLEVSALNLAVRLGILDRSRMMERLASSRRSQVVAAFKRLGTRAKPALPELLTLTRTTDWGIRTAAWQALSEATGDDFYRYLTAKPVQLQSAEVKVESLPEVQ